MQFFLCFFSWGVVSDPVGNWLIQKGHDRKTTLPETNSSPLKINGWKLGDEFLFGAKDLFSGANG